ncbi:MAG: flavin reductase family protein [Candidatus Syntrophoarchaeum sp. WYZ-LMO15]|nr:MAG: flavin reductase family protein [Candidatus Syntrophoarchaeum sp. WYZ-LMO15]
MKLNTKDYPKLLVRPVVVITTVSKDGIPNAAPFSFNSPVSFEPPLYGFSCAPGHDTWRNIQDTGEFVVNVAPEEMGNLMKILEEKYPPEVNEIERAGLTAEASEVVKPPRIKEAVAWIECRLEKAVELGDHVWITGVVVAAGVREGCWDGVFKPESCNPLCHISGEFFAVNMTTKRFERAKKK